MKQTHNLHRTQAIGSGQVVTGSCSCARDGRVPRKRTSGAERARDSRASGASASPCHCAARRPPRLMTPIVRPDRNSRKINLMTKMT